VRGGLAEEYRRLMRWYPKRWRTANEDAMLGALLDQADGEGRPAPSRAERIAIARAGLAQRFGFSRHPSSRVTLALGGSVTALGTIAPLGGRLVFAFPQPLGSAWLDDLWQSFLGPLSAVLVLTGFLLLALGFRSEPGIVRRSLIGRVALITYAAAALVQSLINATLVPTAMTLGTSRSFSETVGISLQASALLSYAMLAIASVFVVRAGVVRGVARWALAVEAVLLVTTSALEYTRGLAVAEILFWGLAVALAVQLATGFLFLLIGLGSTDGRPAGRSGSKRPVSRYASR
jgi:hypothetical protein